MTPKQAREIEREKLKLNLLGAPEARYDGAPVAFATRKALALLAYLALEPGPHRRERLTDMFFPDSDAEHGRAALRRTLALTRQALHDQDVIIGDRETLQLHPDARLDLDTRALERAQHDATDTARQAAFEVYRGDFMAGFSLGDAPDFDDWVGVQREYWRRLFERAADALSQSQLARGDVIRAMDTASRWASHAPLDEAAHRRLLGALFAGNLRSQAIASHEAFRRNLQRELGVEPEAETLALVERIRLGAREPERGRAEGQGRAGPSAPALNIPFVGREAVMADLARAYDRASRGQPSLVLIEGDAGIGKTRLTQEFMAWARARGATTLFGRAFETGGRVPYQPIIDAVREIDDMSDVFDKPSPAAVPETIVRLAMQLARSDAPLVWCVDDAQWLDEASLDVLQLALARWHVAGATVLLIVARRSGEAAPNLDRWLAQAARDGVLHRLRLDELTRDDSVSLIERVAPRISAQSLFDRTRGQPFFLVETMTMLLEQRASVDQELALPASARELIRGRMQQLSPIASTTVVAAAVLGHTFSFDALHAVAGLGEDEGLRALDDLLRARMLQAVANAYSFTHDFIRQVAYEDASEARRRVFHRRAFETLRGLRDSRNVTLAHHAAAAGLSEHAFRYSLAAGDDALRVFAVKQAIEHFRAASELMHAVGAAPIEAQRLRLNLGRAYELAGDRAGATAEYESLLALGRMSNQPVAQCAALNRLATLAAQAFDAERATALLMEAVQVAEQSDNPASLCETEWSLAQTGYYALAPHIALPHAARAVELARNMDDADLLARSLNALAWSSGDFAGDWVTAQACADEARALFAAQGNRALEADCLCCLANARLNCGEAASGLQAARDADAIAREIENDWGQAHAAMQAAKCLYDTGPLNEALATAQRAVEMAQRADAPFLLVISSLLAGDVLRAMGAFDAARDVHRQVCDQLAQAKSPGAAGLLALAHLCVAADDVSAGTMPHLPAEMFDPSQSDIGIAPPHPMLIGLWPMVRALVMVEARPAAEALTRTVARCAEQYARYQVPLLCAQAALSADPVAARAALMDAECVAAQLQLAVDLPQIRRMLG